jgi:hypothetical protein
LVTNSRISAHYLFLTGVSFFCLLVGFWIKAGILMKYPKRFVSETGPV